MFGCSKTDNPMVFTKVEKPVLKVVPPPAPAPTLMELYLSERIGTDYMMNWLFKDYKQYRYKLFYIKGQVELKEPLSSHDRDRVLLLEYVMNDAIRRFNNRNFFSRAGSVIQAGIESRNANPKDTAESLKDIKNKGASAKHISDSPLGYFNSFTRYGFKIEKVKLLNDENIDSERETQE